MEAYPRSTIWPHALLVLVLFSLAAAVPQWWRGREWNRIQRVRPTAELVEHRDSRQAPSVQPVALQARVTVSDRHSPASESAYSRLSTPRVIVAPVDSMEADAPVESVRAVAPYAAPLRTRPIHLVSPGNQVRSPAPVKRGSLLKKGAGSEIGRGESEEVVGHNVSLPVLQPPGRGSASDESDAGRLADDEWLIFDREQLSSHLPEDVTTAAPAPDSERVAGSSWPRATTLLAQLEELPAANASALGLWQRTVRETLERLPTFDRLDDPHSASEIARLTDLATQIPSLERSVSSDDRVLLRQIGYGIRRRAAVWQAVYRMAAADRSVPPVVTTDAQPTLEAVQHWLTTTRQSAETWHDYLQLDKLSDIARASWEADPEVRRHTAREVLDRLDNPQLTESQRRVLQSEPIVDLARVLKSWAAEPLDQAALLHTLEKFESVRSGPLAAQVVGCRETLRWHPATEAKAVQQALDMHYRNANIRIAISGQLINDLLPVLRPIQERVRDNVLGAEVLGQNKTWTDLRVRLIDDDHAIRLRFEADGRARSQTVSIKGPVRFYSHGQARFLADKDLMISPEGVFVRRATADADGAAKLIDLKTDYDGIPLIGWVLRQVALDQHDEQRLNVRRELGQKVSKAARERLDDSIHQQLTNAEQRLTEEVLEPLRRLQLDPQALEMRTTADRIVLRSRIAAPCQLAAYTPRPRALQDSVLSLQIHESAANNLLQQLELEGRKIDMDELMVCLSEKLHINRTDIHEELPENARVRLGYDRPIEVTFNDGLVLLTVRIAELSTGKRTWHNFVVRGRYRADVTRLSVDLSRQGGIELISDEIGFRDQIALRGIFTKVMTRNHRLNLLRDRFIEDRRLASLIVSQFVVRDGWIGISIGDSHRDHVAAERAKPTR